MTDDVFRIVVTVGVGIVTLAVLGQTAVAFALFGLLRRMHEKSGPLIERAQPVFEKIPPLLERVEEAVKKAEPAIEQAGPAIERMRPVIERIGPMMDTIHATIAKIGPVVEKASPVVDKTGEILTNANQLLHDTKPQVVEFTNEMVDIARTGREQVDRIGEVLRDVTGRAQTRIQQIDRTMENTVDQVEHVGDVVKRAVMSPVREVNGIAAGISAAVSTLVSRPKRPSVDEATQDEEMFI